MAISEETARAVVYVIDRYLAKPLALDIMKDLRRIDGGASYNETVRMVEALLLAGNL